MARADSIGELARAPDWPHDRSPYVDERETTGDGVLPDDGTDGELPPWNAEADDELPQWDGEPWKPD